MEQYISKSALVAEIERQISAIDNCPKITNTQISVLEGDKVVLTKLLCFIDTLEVKEVNFDEAGISNELAKYIGSYGSKDLAVAKHFFKLGLKAKKGEEL